MPTASSPTRRHACATIAGAMLSTTSPGAGASDVAALARKALPMRNPLPALLLATEQPNPALGAQAQLFDRVTGSWELDNVFTAADGTESRSAGEWHFGWILGGHMMQDTIFNYPKGQRPAELHEMRGGTTLRLFDAKSKQWLVSFFAPLRSEVIHLRGGAEGNRIVLRGLDVDGSHLRWSFNDITDTSFRWVGETSVDGGARWRIEQVMDLRRMPVGATP